MLQQNLPLRNPARLYSHSIPLKEARYNRLFTRNPTRRLSGRPPPAHPSFLLHWLKPWCCPQQASAHQRNLLPFRGTFCPSEEPSAHQRNLLPVRGTFWWSEEPSTDQRNQRRVGDLEQRLGSAQVLLLLRINTVSTRLTALFLLHLPLLHLLLLLCCVRGSLMNSEPCFLL